MPETPRHDSARPSPESGPPADTPASHPDRKGHLLVTSAIMGVIFLAAMDITAVSPAMPRIVGALGGGRLFAWAFSIYALLSTTATPLFGRIADRRGRKPTLLAGVAVFLVGSAAAGAAPTMPLFIVARGVQGIGAAALMTTSFTIVGDLYDLRARARIQGYLSGVWGVASVLGPLVGGTLVETAGWRWLFYMNLPIGLSAAVLLARHLHERGYPRQGAPLDLTGATAFSIAVLALLAGLKLEGSGRLLALTVAILAAGLFVWREIRSASPLFDLSLFRIPVFRSANAAGLFAGAVLLSLSAYLPVFIMNVRSGTAVLSGLLLTPMSLGWVLCATVGGRLLVRSGYARIAIPGLSVIVAGVFLISRITQQTPYAVLLAIMFAIGCGFGLSFTIFLVAVQEEAGQEKRGQATSGVQFFRQIGGALGVAVLELAYLSHISDPSLLEATPGRPFSPGERTELTAGFESVFGWATLMALVALLSALFAPRGRRPSTGAATVISTEGRSS